VEHRGRRRVQNSHRPEMAMKDDGNHFAMTNGGDAGFALSNHIEGCGRASSPWMSHPSEITLQTNNLTPCKDNEPTDLATIPSNATPSSSKVTTPQHEYHHTIENDTSARRQQQPQHPQHQRKTTKSLLQKYRTFLQKHEPSLLLLEHVMERFVFYRYLFHHDHRGIRTEMYYATWNIIRWTNDVILVGWGEGMGLTVGRREEWLGNERKFISVAARGTTGEPKNVSEEALEYIQDWMLARLNRVVPLIRAALTATTCLYPALEAWSRRGRRIRTNRIGRDLLSFEEDPHNLQLKEYQWRATTTDPSPNRRRKAWESTQRNMAEASRRLERWRFYGRLGLLAISWWARYRRNCAQQKCEEDEELPRGYRFGQKREKSVAVPSLLRGGGELDPYERLVPLQEAEDEAKIVQYVGRRTGRRSVSRSTGLPKSSCVRRTSSTPSSFSANFAKWLSGVASSSNNILYAYAVGELLHILRPYYWSNAECTEWRGRSSTSRTTMPGESRSKRRATSYSLAIWKAWWISLLMDLLSDKLLRVSTNGNGNTQPLSNNARRTSLLSRGNGRHSNSNSSSSSPSAEQAKLEELDWRRSRHVLHLLRSPMYDSVTRPLVMFVGRVLAMFPSFGLGRWAAGYALDMMNYWNEHRFMLES